MTIMRTKIRNQVIKKKKKKSGDPFQILTVHLNLNVYMGDLFYFSEWTVVT